MKNYCLQILNWIAAVTLFLIIISLAQYLIASKIVAFRWDWMVYFYWFGIGILSSYPTNFILKYHKTL